MLSASLAPALFRARSFASIQQGRELTQILAQRQRGESTNLSGGGGGGELNSSVDALSLSPSSHQFAARLLARLQLFGEMRDESLAGRLLANKQPARTTCDRAKVEKLIPRLNLCFQFEFLSVAPERASERELHASWLARTLSFVVIAKKLAKIRPACRPLSGQ